MEPAANAEGGDFRTDAKILRARAHILHRAFAATIEPSVHV